MSGIPTRRLLVYVIAGMVVLAVGTFAVVSMRDGASADPGVKIAAGDMPAGVSAAGTGEAHGALAGSAAVTSSTTSTAPPTIFVQVAGAVRRPGVYEMGVAARVFEVIDRAGGFAEDADPQSVTLATRLTDGCRIYVPRVGETAQGAVASPEKQTIAGAGGSGGSATSGTVSINSAGVEEFDTLPGIGPAIAEDIVTYREANGPFTSIEQLTDVPGIGPSKLEQLRPFVTL
jgi:competence protein ComEA